MKRHRRIGLCLALTATATFALAGCSGGPKPSSADAAAASSALARLSRAAAALTSSGGAEPQGSPTGKIRVINLYSVGGQPGGAVDLFDVFHPTASDVPIIKDLAYGQVSDYVSPRAGGQGNPSQLFIFPAGSVQPSGAYTGSNLSQSGWTADQQVTVVLMPSSSAGSFGSKDLNDAPTADAAATPPAGDATILTWNADVNLTDAPTAYLTVDGKCSPALDQSAGFPGTLGGTFAVSPGTHTLGVIGMAPGSGTTTQKCAAAAASPADTQTVTADSGGQIDVVGYGDSAATLKLVVAPVSAVG